MIDHFRSLLRQRTSARSQVGYILVTTLLAMLLCTILASTMLAVTASTVKVEESGRVRERQLRAAEGALDVAINEIRNNPTMAASDLPLLSEPGNARYDASKKPNEQLPKVPGDSGYDSTRDPAVNLQLNNALCNPLNNLVTVDTVPVRIYCYNDGLWEYDAQGNQVPGIPTDDGGVAVRLVGGEYQGDPVPGSDPIADVARTWKTGFPFTGAMQNFSQAEVNATAGQLVYTGDTPLRIVGGVEVKNQIAAVTATGRPGPAIEVDGVVAQGGPGMFDPETGTKGCGIAEPLDSFGASRTDVQASSIYVAPGTSLICNENELSVMGAGGLPLPNGEWDNTRVQRNRYQDWDGNNSIFKLNQNGVYDAFPTDCDTIDTVDGVVSIPAGSYDARATKILNSWFTGGCPGRTFYFEGGDYWFDVDDPALPESDPRKHSLVFADRESNWVFGPALNWAGARPSIAQFPEACDRRPPSPTSPDLSRGVSITLSSRTGIHHTAGRVAICGSILKQQAGNPPPTQTTTISQRPATSLGARLLPNAWLDVTSGVQPFAGSADAPRAADRNTARVTQPVTLACWDSGTCLTRHTLRVTGLGTRASDGIDPGPGVLGSAWVDLTADAEFANNPQQNLAFTRFGVTLSDGKTCSARFGTTSKSLPNRTADNYATISYNLLDDPLNDNLTDGIDSTCDTVLTGAGVGREDFRNATINVEVGLNPPKQANTRFGSGVFGGIIRWLCKNIAEPIGDFTGWYRVNCDNRPTSVTYAIDALAVRLGWTPSFDTPVSAAGTCSNCDMFENASQGAREVPSLYASTTTPAVSSPTTSFSVLRFPLQDPNLLDGFLPVRSLTVNAKMRKPATANATDKVDFVLKTHTGIWCRASVAISSITNDVEQPITLTPSNGNTCRQGASGPFVTSVDIGELVGHKDPLNNSVASTLDVEVILANTGAARTFEIDYATLTGTAGDVDGSGNVLGYPRPKDPFTVTWNPLTPNSTFIGATGDATFNVFGPVSVPNNDVRVRFNWQANSSGQVGFPIFNGANVTADKCSATTSELCRPALVASALGSWTTGAWPASPTPVQRPDAIASSGSTRKPIRQVVLVACVVDGGGASDQLLPRSEARVRISDKDGKALSPGAKVTVDRFRHLEGPSAYKTGAAASTDPCNVFG
jgi:hypothetical protein